MKTQLKLTLLSMVLLISACELINNDGKNDIKTTGIFVVNEGNFSSNNGDVSFYDPANATIQNSLFLNANGAAAGDIVQDMMIHDTMAILTINNSNLLRVVGLSGFKKIKDIKIPQPRFIAKVSETEAYVTCWDNYVRILDMNSLTITDSIKVGSYPEDILVHHSVAYIANSGFGDDNRLTAINTLNHAVSHLRVGYGPTKIALHHNDGRLYIACTGNEFNTPKIFGGIYIVDESNFKLVDSIIRIPNQSSFDTLFVSRIAVHDSRAYFITGYSGPIQVLNLTSKAVTDTIPGAYYNVEVNYEDESDENIYATTPATSGKFKIFDDALTMIHEFTTGDFPNSIVFTTK